MQYLLDKLNVLKEYKKTLDFLCGFTIIGPCSVSVSKSDPRLCYHMDIERK